MRTAFLSIMQQELPKKYHWAKQRERIGETIPATYDPYKEWHPDPKGYFLIRVNRAKKRIEVGFVTPKHVITKMIYGTQAIALYNTIVRRKLLTRLEHAAYLGKELYKAELALQYGKEYRQEVPLRFMEVKEKVKLGERS